MENVLITGGAGFIGSNLVDSLLKDGNYSIMVLDNYLTGRRGNLPEDNSNLIVVEEDIRNTEGLLLSRLAGANFNPDIIVHAAASYKDPTDFIRDANTNVGGTAKVLEIAKGFNVKRLIYFQTSLCYGLHPEDSPLTTESKLNPEGSSYAITKTAGESLIRIGDVPYISFRLANVFGPRNLTGPVPTFYQRLKQGKKCFVMKTRRDFIFIEDLVKLVVRAVKGEGKDNSVYHISTGSDYAISEMYDAVLNAMGEEDNIDRYPAEIREPSEDDAPTLLIDPSKTEKDFPKWKADYLFEEGIKKAVEWYDNNQFSETYTHLKNVKD